MHILPNNGKNYLALEEKIINVGIPRKTNTSKRAITKHQYPMLECIIWIGNI